MWVEPWTATETVRIVVKGEADSAACAGIASQQQGQKLTRQMPSNALSATQSLQHSHRQNAQALSLAGRCAADVVLEAPMKLRKHVIVQQGGCAPHPVTTCYATCHSMHAEEVPHGTLLEWRRSWKGSTRREW